MIYANYLLINVHHRGLVLREEFHISLYQKPFEDLLFPLPQDY